MKNYTPWVLSINLLLFAFAFFRMPFRAFELHIAFFALNLLAGLSLWFLGKKALAKVFLLASFVVPLIGLGVCAVILSNI